MRESLALSRTLNDTRTTPYILMLLGQMELEQGNYTQAASLLWESLALKRTSGDPAPGVLMHLGQLALAQGDYTYAQRRGEESLEACQQERNTFYASPALRVLGAAALAQGDYKRARTFLRESVARSRTIRHRRTIAFALAAFAGAVASDPESLADDMRAAARIWGTVEELREEVGIFLPVAERTCYEQAVATVRAHLDEATFAAAWAEGRAMTLEHAIAYALETPGEAPSSVVASDSGGQERARSNTRRATRLSAREVDVLGLVAEGYTDQEVAARLGLRPRTVTSYLSSIYDKLEVRTRMAAVRVARTQQIL
jgi:ATP/maltotriose-dependent transcriptional regulator MalT